MPHNNQKSFGINNSHLRIEGIFKTLVEIENVETEICFALVPNEPMALVALLGRGFTSRSDMKNLVIKAMQLEKDDTINFIDELKSINYLILP